MKLYQRDVNQQFFFLNHHSMYKLKCKHRLNLSRKDLKQRFSKNLHPLQRIHSLIFISMRLITTNWMIFKTVITIPIHYSGDVWVMLMVVCMIVGVLLAIINRYSPSEWSKIPEPEDKTNSRDSFTVKNALFFVHTTVCWQGKRFWAETKVLKVLKSLLSIFFWTKTRISHLIWF